jgi:photosystem II stability/assembly factor-like uncharacterized protein
MGQNHDIRLIFDRSFKVPNASIRAIETDGEQGLWFAASNGQYGFIDKEKMLLDSISHEGQVPNFRSLAVNGDHAFLLSIEDPALLFRVGMPPAKRETELVYREDHPDVFYDSMTFLNRKDGVAMGDPTEGCLSILLTRDGGNTWSRIPCSELPETIDGEAGFAASDTNIATRGENIWIAIGGSRSRIWRSTDKGVHWEVFETPLVEGKKMTGIYSLDFSSATEGIIMGGNWERKDDCTRTKALSRDGGVTWELIADKKMPGYISCVQYVPETQGKEIMAVSTEGIYYSGDHGQNWTKLSQEGFFSLRFETRNSAWLSRQNEIVHVILDRPEDK